MEAGEYTVRRILVPPVAMKSFLRIAREEVSKSGDGLLVTNLDTTNLFGDTGLNAAIYNTIQDLNLGDITIRSWHLLRQDQHANTDCVAQDNSSATSKDAVCVRLPLFGRGEVKVMAKCGVSQTRRKTSVWINEKQCMIYRSYLPYALTATCTVFLHCICTTEIQPPSQIYNPVRFACPYKHNLASDEIRVYPSRYVEPPSAETASSCEYSAQRWKNVLDHLAFCKSNPAVEECERKKESRRSRNAVAVRCIICDLVLPSKNTLAKHKSRKHRIEKAVNKEQDESTETTPSTVGFNATMDKKNE